MGMDNKMIQTTREVVPVIYAYTTPEIARHDGWTKIGDTGRETGKRLDEQMLTSDFTSNSDIDWNKSISDIDKQLYQKYGLSDDEINFIETHVKEK